MNADAELREISGEMHNRALHAAIAKVTERFGGFRCEAAGCPVHGGEFGTVFLWGWGVEGVSRLVCKEHWNLWQADEGLRYLGIGPGGRDMAAQERLAVLWGWGHDPRIPEEL